MTKKATPKDGLRQKISTDILERLLRFADRRRQPFYFGGFVDEIMAEVDMYVNEEVKKRVCNKTIINQMTWAETDWFDESELIFRLNDLNFQPTMFHILRNTLPRKVKLIYVKEMK